MAKKIKVDSFAELQNATKEDELTGDEQAKLIDRERIKAEKLELKKEELIAFDVGRFPSGKAIEIQINNKVYHGLVNVPLGVMQLLREMSEKIKEREASIYVGKKFQGQGAGNRAMRNVGNT